LLKQSRDNIEALYHDRGYEEVKVTSQVIDREPNVDVAFDIQEGPLTLVDDIQVTGNQTLSSEQLAAPTGFQLRSGEPFSPRKTRERSQPHFGDLSRSRISQRRGQDFSPQKRG